MASQQISWGIGSPADIGWFITLGLGDFSDEEAAPEIVPSGSGLYVPSGVDPSGIYREWRARQRALLHTRMVKPVFRRRL